MRGSVESALEPAALLATLKVIERAFGRRGGKRWGARVLDLDILAWEQGPFRSRRLTIPHPALESRSFMLQPLAAIAPALRIRGGAKMNRVGHGPFLTLTARHLAHRLAGAPRAG